MTERIEFELPGAGKVTATVNDGVVELGDICLDSDITMDRLFDLVSQALGKPIKQVNARSITCKNFSF